MTTPSAAPAETPPTSAWVRPARRCWMAMRSCENEPVYTFHHGLLGVGVTCQEHTRQLEHIVGGCDLIPLADAPHREPHAQETA